MEILEMAKSKNGVIGKGKSRTMFDEYNNNQIVEVKIPIDGVGVVEWKV